jgi:hypothetical protein
MLGDLHSQSSSADAAVSRCLGFADPQQRNRTSIVCRIGFPTISYTANRAVPLPCLLELLLALILLLLLPQQFGTVQRPKAEKDVPREIQPDEVRHHLFARPEAHPKVPADIREHGHGKRREAEWCHLCCSNHQPASHGLCAPATNKHGRRDVAKREVWRCEAERQDR